ncbi:hypothetical protein PGT21_035570 [Puccinia graminis f. sp. tritici]|uniref:Uncharacterized protein n=1 Tax=Puccinia graminis f. sp. tritici TaxID=56615 RepID=A0A5B0PGZ8_PUCGR|nr:hypothetical protein PGT21_035570 [Puccinia graminis f. sp. tritici]KAA1100303.1 hypothetical protein PGTUg99_012553 [Puccinia graminis f. sp. tritici]
MRFSRNYASALWTSLLLAASYVAIESELHAELCQKECGGFATKRLLERKTCGIDFQCVQKHYHRCLALAYRNSYTCKSCKHQWEQLDCPVDHGTIFECPSTKFNRPAKAA